MRTSLQAAVFAGALATLAACSTQVEPTNPFDPATPLERQAKATVRGVLAAPTLPSAADIALSLAAGGQPAREGRTGQTGQFVFDALTPGSYTLTCTLAGFAPFSLVLSLARGETLDLGTITLAPLSGGDASAFTGRVTLENQSDYGGTLVEAVGRGFTTVTDSGGNFRLRVIEGTYDLKVSRAGFVAGQQLGLVVGRGEERALGTMTLLANPARLSGHVDGEHADGTRGALSNALVTLEGTAITGLTNAQGDFTLTGIPPGSYLVRATADGHVGASAAALGLEGGQIRSLRDPVYLPLARGRITGRVALAGTSDASGAVVELTGSGRAVVTGADGAFAFDALVGDWGLTARRDGYSPASVALVTVGEGATADVGTLTLGRTGGAVAVREAPYAAARTVHLLLDSPGALGFRASEDPAFASSALGDTTTSPWRAYVQGQAEAFTLADADGEHTVYVVFQTQAGAGAPAAARVVLDRQAPSAPSVVVGTGAAATRAPGGIVSLSLSAVDRPAAAGAAVAGVARMELSNAADFSGSQLVDFARTWTWTLADPATQGPKTVHARFVDGAGNVSAAASATVLFDTVAPDSPTLALAGADAGTPGYTRSPLVAVLASVHDANGGPGNQDLFVRLSNTDGFVGASWQPFSSETTWLLPPGDGPKTVYAEFMDAAGNVSPRVSASITLDTAGPTSPSIAIAEQDSRPANGYTNVATVRLTLAAAGAARAVVAEEQSLAGGTTFDLATMPVDWVLARAGAHTLWVRFFDAAGNASDLASATVTLDQQPPVAAAPVLAPAGFTSGFAVTLTPPGAGQDELRVTGDLTSPSGWVPAPAGIAVPVTLSAGAGPKALSVSYRDLADNETAAGAVTVTVDTAPPALPALVVHGALADGTASSSLTVTPSVTLDLSAASDGAGAGVAQMLLSESATFAGASWQPFAASAPFTLSAGDGTKTVYARLRDALGNELTTPASASIVLDTAGPSGASVAIVENDARPSNGATSSRSCGLTLDATGGPVQALVAENPTFAGAVTVSLAGRALPYTTPVTGAGSFTLSDADGPHTVWVKYLDGAGNASTPVAAQVVLDRVAPAALAPTIAPAPFAGSTAIQVTPPAAGQDELELSGAGLSGTPTWRAAPAGVPLAATLTGGDGVKAITVRYRDAADNVTTVGGLSVTLDLTPPVVANFTVAGRLADGLSDGIHTATPSVTLDLTGQGDGAGSGIAEVMLSNDAGFAGASWQPYVASSAVPWLLTPGDGLRTVYARFRDQVGHVSAAVQGQIELREQAPSGGAVVIASGARATSAATVSLAISAVGAAEMQIAVDGVPGAWRPYATSATATLLDPDQTAKVVTVAFRNVARVEGGGASSSIWFDHHPPTAPAVTLAGSLGNGATSSAYSATAAVVVQAPPPSADAVQMAIAAAPGTCAAALAAPAWQPAAAQATFLLVGADGPKTVCVLYRDDAGNFDPANAASASIVLDTAPPTNPAFADLASRATAAVAVAGTLTADSTDATSAVAYQCIGGASYGSAWTDCTPTSGRTFTFGLLPNQANTLGVRARDQAHNYSSAATVRIVHDDLAPLPPYVTAVQTTRDTIRIAWQPSASEDAVSYRVNYGMAPGDTSGNVAAQGPSPIDVGAANAFQLDGLLTGAGYYVSVVAVDEAGNVSLPSTERVAVPYDVNPRLLSTYGSDFAKVALRADGGRTWSFVAAREGLLMLDATDPDAPRLVGRAALPGVMPSSTSDLPAVPCTRDARSGFCLFVAGSTLEASYRPDPSLYRAAVSVVFLAAGTEAEPAVGEVLGSLGVRGEHVVLSPDEAFLYVLDRDAVHAFSLGSDPGHPRRVGGGQYRTPDGAAVAAVRLRGAGLVGTSLHALFTPPGGTPLLGTWSVASPAAGLPGSSVSVHDGVGRSLLVPDWQGKTMEPLALVANGAIYIAWNTVSETVPTQDQFRIGRFSPAGGPTYWVTCDTYRHPPALAAAGQGRAFFLAPTQWELDAFRIVDSGSALSCAYGWRYGDGGVSVNTVSLAALPSGNADTLYLASRTYAGILRLWFQTAEIPGDFVYDEAAALSVAKIGDVVFSMAGSYPGTLRAVDVSNPLRPRRIDVGASVTQSVDWPIAAHGRTLVVGNQVFTVSPSGSVGSARSFSGKLAGLVGKYAYARVDVNGQPGYTVAAFDASLATSPLPVAASVAIPYGALDMIAVVGAASGHLYLVDSAGLTVLRQTSAGGVITLSRGARVTFPTILHRGSLQARYANGLVTASDGFTGSYVVDVTNEAAPTIVPSPSSLFAVGGPMLLQHGYGVGPALTPPNGRPESGIRFVASSGDLAGTQPFGGCGADSSTSIRASLLASDGIYYAACPRVGMQVISAANPSAGTLRADRPFPSADATRAALALDGAAAFLGGGAMTGTSTGSVWRAGAAVADADVTLDPIFNRTLDAGGASVPTTLTLSEGVLWATFWDGRYFAGPSVGALDVSGAPSVAFPRLGTVALGPIMGMVLAQPVTDDETIYVAAQQGLVPPAVTPAPPEISAVDIRDPSAPALRWVLSSGVVGDTYAGLALARQRLYAARNGAAPAEVDVWDVSGVSPAALTSVAVSSLAPVSALRELAVQGPYLFFTYDSRSGVAPFGLAVVKLGPNGSGAGATLVGTWESGLPLGSPNVVGDLLYVRANQGLAVFDLTPTWRDGRMPVSLGLRGPAEGTSSRSASRLVVDGPWAFLLGDHYRVFDLR